MWSCDWLQREKAAVLLHTSGRCIPHSPTGKWELVGNHNYYISIIFFAGGVLLWSSYIISIFSFLVWMNLNIIWLIVCRYLSQILLGSYVSWHDKETRKTVSRPCSSTANFAVSLKADFSTWFPIILFWEFTCCWVSFRFFRYLVSVAPC